MPGVPLLNELEESRFQHALKPRVPAVSWSQGTADDLDLDLDNSLTRPAHSSPQLSLCLPLALANGPSLTCSVPETRGGRPVVKVDLHSFCPTASAPEACFLPESCLWPISSNLPGRYRLSALQQ